VRTVNGKKRPGRAGWTEKKTRQSRVGASLDRL
jgi:hypothetical protein